jgi:HSP20 family protein
MALRPPRAGFSVARRLSERARAQRAAQSPADQAATEAAAAPFIDGSGFAGMVDALRGLVEQLARTAEQAGSETDASGDAADAPAHGGAHSVTFGGGKGRMVFGYTLRMGEGGVSAEPFGDVPDAAAPVAGAARPSKPAAREPGRSQPAARQPIVDVFEDDGAVVVVAELPGADPEGIVCQAEGSRLLIEAAGARRYRKEIALPVAVRADGMRQSFRTGILEVRLARADGP